MFFPIFVSLFYYLFIGILHCVKIHSFWLWQILWWVLTYSTWWYLGFCTVGTIFIDYCTVFSEIYFSMVVFRFSTVQSKWLLLTILLLVPCSRWLLIWYFLRRQLSFFFAGEPHLLFFFCWWVLVPWRICLSMLSFYFYRSSQSHSFVFKTCLFLGAWQVCTKTDIIRVWRDSSLDTCR